MKLFLPPTIRVVICLCFLESKVVIRELGDPFRVREKAVFKSLQMDKSNSHCSALDIILGDGQGCDPKKASQVFVKSNWHRRMRCMFQDLKALSARASGTRCMWHPASGSGGDKGPSPCAPARHVHGVVGSASCHPFTPVAIRPEGYHPADHADWPMLMGPEDSLLACLEREDPDFWITENVDGMTQQPQSSEVHGSEKPIDEFMGRVDGIKLENGEPRYASTWRFMNQSDHTKGKRKRTCMFLVVG